MRLKKYRKAKLTKKFIRYAIVGAIGTAIYLFILTLLIEFLRYDPVISSALAFILIVIISYILNYKWTFRAKSRHRISFPRYLTVSFIGLLLNTIIMFLAVNVFSIWYGLAQVIAIVLIPISNFILNFYWSFKSKN
jgi:putative flippase GtrA